MSARSHSTLRWLLLLQLLASGCATVAPLPLPSGPPLSDPSMQGCRSTPPLQLTFGGQDEDGTFLEARDGRYYYSWISSRNGSVDIFMAASLDGESWTRGRPIIATPRDDYLANLAQHPDGTFVVAGGIWDEGTELRACESRDTWSWSAPRAIADMGHPPVTMESGPGGAILRIDRNGRYWLMFSSNLTGNKEIWLQHSDDRARTWSRPVSISRSPRQDDYLAFRIDENGRFGAVWICQEHDPEHRWFDQYHSWSTDICAATSDDGIHWSNFVITNDPPDAPQLDNFPALIDGPGGLHVVWFSSRTGAPGTWNPRLVVLPLQARGDLSRLRVFPHMGFSVRGIGLRDGRYLVSWVRDHPGGRDNFYQLFCNFDFGPNPLP